MKKIIIFSILAFLIALSACEKVIPLNTEYQAPRLVVNSYIQKDSLIKVSLTCSRIIIDNASVKHVAGAEVKLYKNGNFLGNLLEENNLYVSEFKAEEGAEYSLEASAQGYDDVTCKTTLPYSSPIISIDTASSIDEYGGPSLKFSIKFPLDKDTEEYFMIRCQNVYPSVNMEDEYYYYQPDYNYIESNDVIVEAYDDGGILFSDRLIQTDTYTFNGSIGNYFYDTIWLKFEFASLNKDMFEYLVTRSMHFQAQGNPLMEPVIVYSNVSSGMGIMGGGSVSVDSVMLTPSYTDIYY